MISPVKKLHSQFIFQPHNRLGQGGLGDEEPLGGPAEVPLLRDVYEGAKLAQVEGGHDEQSGRSFTRGPYGIVVAPGKGRLDLHPQDRDASS